jgi:hypothetical protein
VNQASSISLLDPVALLVDAPAHGLARGQVGTVVEQLDPHTWEVEFSDDEGRCYALLTLSSRDLLPLRYTPRRAA